MQADMHAYMPTERRLGESKERCIHAYMCMHKHMQCWLSGRLESRRLGAEQHGAVSALHERLLRERAAHGRAMRLANQQASADLQSARDAWAHERRRMHEASGSSAASAANGQLHQLHQSAQHLAAENQRLHTALAASQQRLEATLDKLGTRDTALKALEASLVAVQVPGWHGNHQPWAALMLTSPGPHVTLMPH